MDHIAIDLGGAQSQVCVRAGDGTVLVERRCRTAELEAYLASRPPSRVVVETCAEAFSVADSAKRLGHEVRVVAATLVRTLGVGARGVKTDRRDAQVLSEVSCRIDLPSVHVPSAQSRERKSLCGMRDVQVHCRTMLINSVRGWMRTRMDKVKSGTTQHFPLRVRAFYGDKLPEQIAWQLMSIERLTEQIKSFERVLQSMAKEDPVCRRLMTVPGVGWLTALRFVATLDEIGRFANAHQVESYLGLTPGEDSSSERQRRTSITKAGSPSMRWLLVQAAWSARRARRKDALQLWAEQLEQRRGKRVAVVALARKLAGILFAIWRDGSTYRAEEAAAASS